MSEVSDEEITKAAHKVVGYLKDPTDREALGRLWG